MLTEGIILKTKPLREYDLYISLFTKELGLIRSTIPYGNHPKKRAHLSPTTQIECRLKKANHGFFKLQEISLVNPYIELRNSLELLNSSLALIDAIQKSQMEQKQAPKLYKLLAHSLKNLPNVSKTEALIASFTLKILRHDGLLPLNNPCIKCQKPLKARSFFSGEFFCPTCAGTPALPFSEEESQTLFLLAFLPSYSELETLPITQTFLEKIHTLFQIQIDR